MSLVFQYFYIFRYYNIISLLFLSLSSKPFCINLLPDCGLFFMVVAYICVFLHTHTHIYITCIYLHKYVNTACCFHILLLECVCFQVWPFTFRFPVGVLFLWKEHLSQSQLTSVAYYTLYRDDIVWIFPIYFRFLRFSVVISVCWKEKIHWCGLRTTVRL